jgi:Zn-finger nucleic acid-binding protein
MNHVFEKHDPMCESDDCPICGGLCKCIVCGGAECELTTHCKGMKLDQHLLDKICRKELDYFEGFWIKPRTDKRIDTKDRGTYYRWSFN